MSKAISGKTETYSGLSELPFKSRYGGNLTIFKNKNANHTTLSKHVPTQLIGKLKLGAKLITPPMTSTDFVTMKNIS